MQRNPLNRRGFVETTLSMAAAATLAPADVLAQASEQDKPKRTRVAVIGCGSVSHVYLPHLAACPYVELVSTCDIKPERAQRQAARFQLPHHYPHIDQLLAGTPFDLLV